MVKSRIDIKVLIPIDKLAFFAWEKNLKSLMVGIMISQPFPFGD